MTIKRFGFIKHPALKKQGIKLTPVQIDLLKDIQNSGGEKKIIHQAKSTARALVNRDLVFYDYETKTYVLSGKGSKIVALLIAEGI